MATTRKRKAAAPVVEEHDDLLEDLEDLEELEEEPEEELEELEEEIEEDLEELEEEPEEELEDSTDKSDVVADLAAGLAEFIDARIQHALKASAAPVAKATKKAPAQKATKKTAPATKKAPAKKTAAPTATRGTKPLSAVRTWAQKKGLPVADRGRISAEIKAEFTRRTGYGVE